MRNSRVPRVRLHKTQEIKSNTNSRAARSTRNHKKNDLNLIPVVACEIQCNPNILKGIEELEEFKKIEPMTCISQSVIGPILFSRNYQQC